MTAPTHEAMAKAIAEANREKRLAQLERALVRRGVADDNLDDAVSLLDRDLDDDADEDTIAGVADVLKVRRGELFGGAASAPSRPTRPSVPGGGRLGRRNGPVAKEPGADGRARAEKRWGTGNGDAPRQAQNVQARWTENS